MNEAKDQNLYIVDGTNHKTLGYSAIVFDGVVFRGTQRDAGQGKAWGFDGRLPIYCNEVNDEGTISKVHIGDLDLSFQLRYSFSTGTGDALGCSCFFAFLHSFVVFHTRFPHI